MTNCGHGETTLQSYKRIEKCGSQQKYYSSTQAATTTSSIHCPLHKTPFPRQNLPPRNLHPRLNLHQLRRPQTLPNLLQTTPIWPNQRRSSRPPRRPRRARAAAPKAATLTARNYLGHLTLRAPQYLPYQLRSKLRAAAESPASDVNLQRNKQLPLTITRWLHKSQHYSVFCIVNLERLVSVFRRILHCIIKKRSLNLKLRQMQFRCVLI